MSRGKAYNIWKTKSKYISRLKKNMYNMLVADEEKAYYVKASKIIVKYYKNWRRPRTWKELDEKGGHSKLLKKTPVIYKKSKWDKVDDRNRIKDLREESRKLIDEELNNGDM